MPDMESIATAIEVEIRRMAGLDAADADFARDTHIFDYGYVDSFGAAELVTFVEQRFGIKVSDDDLATTPLNTVNEIAALVAGRLSVDRRKF